MRTCWTFVMVICSMLLTGVVHPAPPATEPTGVYVKVIYLLKQPGKEKDRPESWIAKELTDRGHINFMAVSDWIRLGDLNAEKSTVVWNGASDWIDGEHQVQACPGFGRITERAGGNLNVEIDAFMPVVNMVRVNVPDKLGAKTLAMAVEDQIYVALQVGQPPKTPATQPTSSKPVVQNGLQITTTLPKATFTVDEPLKFNVQFKNVSEKPLLLYDADYFWNWRVTFEDQRKIGPWRLNKLFKDQRIRPEVKTLKPGETLDVAVNFDPKEHSFEFAWEGLRRNEVQPVKNLPLGKYELVIDMTITDNPFDVRRQFSFYWTGQIKTNPVEFEITGNPDRKEH